VSRERQINAERSKPGNESHLQPDDTESRDEHLRSIEFHGSFPRILFHKCTCFRECRNLISRKIPTPTACASPIAHAPRGNSAFLAPCASLSPFRRRPRKCGKKRNSRVEHSSLSLILGARDNSGHFAQAATVLGRGRKGVARKERYKGWRSLPYR